MRPRARHYAWFSVALAVPAIAVFIPWDTPPDPLYLQRIDERLEMARREDAATHAPLRLEAAEAGAQAARVALARQKSRLPLLRDYGPARFSIQEAAVASTAALDGTRAEVLATQNRAGQAIENATRHLTRARAAAGTAHVGAEGRGALMQAEIALDEARRHYSRGAYTSALVRATVVLRTGDEWESRSAERLERFRDPDALRRWEQWITETVAWSRREDDYAIVVDKVDRLLILYQGGTELVTIPVDLGIDPVGRKLQEGDNATPEGQYRITEVRQGGQTRYHRALMLDYPNAEDRVRFREAKEAGTVPADAVIGGLIEIHGMGGRQADWTNGCVAVTNRDMDALVELVRTGTPVTIVGRRPQTPAPGLAAAVGETGG